MPASPRGAAPGHARSAAAQRVVQRRSDVDLRPLPRVTGSMCPATWSRSTKPGERRSEPRTAAGFACSALASVVLSATMQRWLLSALVGVLLSMTSGAANAQYRSGQFGFEAGYLGFAEPNSNRATEVENHGPMVGIRAGYRITDNVWLTQRAALSWRDQQPVRFDETIFVLHLVPVAARYYFATDRIRPFVGVTNTVQFFTNGQAGNAFWGPGGSAGVEWRWGRDIFSGLQVDVFHVWGAAE